MICISRSLIHIKESFGDRVWTSPKTFKYQVYRGGNGSVCHATSGSMELWACPCTLPSKLSLVCFDAYTSATTCFSVLSLNEAAQSNQTLSLSESESEVQALPHRSRACFPCRIARSRWCGQRNDLMKSLKNAYFC